MSSKDKPKYRLATFDFFYITALKVLADIDWLDITPVEGKTRRGLARYESTERIPFFKEFQITFNNKSMTLQEFASKFKDIKEAIFAIIDKTVTDNRKDNADGTATETAEAVRHA